MKETGIVKWFNSTKGYGFISRDGGRGELFVHFSEIVGDGFRELHEGERVEFREAEGQGGKGNQAKEVVRI